MQWLIRPVRSDGAKRHRRLTADGIPDTDPTVFLLKSRGIQHECSQLEMSVQTIFAQVESDNGYIFRRRFCDGHEFYSKRMSGVEVRQYRLELKLMRQQIQKSVVGVLSATMTFKKNILKNWRQANSSPDNSERTIGCGLFVAQTIRFLLIRYGQFDARKIRERDNSL